MDDNYIICKPGFTENIDQRKHDLENKYRIELILISIKKVNFLREEKQFHTKLKTYYPHLVINKLNGVATNEMYVFNEILLDEFNNYEIGSDKKYEYKIEKEKTKQKQIELKIREEELKIKEEETKQIKLQIEYEKPKSKKYK